jgi:hypothetical protein
LGDDIRGFGEEGSKYLKDTGYTSGVQFMQKFEEGVAFESKYGDAVKAFTMLGIQDVEGMIKGLESEYGNLQTAFVKLGLIGIKQYAKDHAIKSPSRVFKQYGIYDVLGLINGVTSKEDALKKTYSAMAASNIAAYTSAMSSNVSSIPFTPVLNTSGIQNGTRILQGQLSGLTTNPIGATLTSRLAASVDTSQIDTDNSRIVSSLADLKTELYELGEKMANLQVVMDTGATVGALAPGMDMELGRRIVRKQRGV